MKARTLLYFYVGRSTFIQKDIEIFKSEFKVLEFNFQSNSKFLTPFLFAKQFIFLIRYFFSASLIVSHFSGYHSFLPGLFGKLSRTKSLITAGGTDCHSFPSIGYGNFSKILLGIFTRMSYRLCDHISPKHQSLWECEYTYESKDFSKQGIKAFMPNLNKEYTVIPNGFDSDLFQCKTEKIPDSFLCIAGNLNYSFQSALKGVDLILEVSKKFQQCSFTIVGNDDSVDKRTIPSNVQFIGSQSTQDLIELYSKHRYYLQLSMAEGFPNSLCEAMLCGCYPIGSNVFSIPEIIGNTGSILFHRNAKELSNIIDFIQNNLSVIDQGKIRSRITESYSLSQRKSSLLQLCRRLAK